MNFKVKVIYKNVPYIIAEFMEKKDAVSFAKNKVKKLRLKNLHNQYNYIVVDTFNDVTLYNSFSIYE